MPQFEIDAEFQLLLPQLNQEEREGLRLQLETDGCLSPLIVARIGRLKILMDGHNRYFICREKGIPFTVKEIAFANKDQAKEWIIAHQLGRRNLTDKERTFYISELYKTRRQQHGGPREEQGATVAPCSQKTAQKIAEEQGISERTVYNAAKFGEAVERIAEVAGPEAKREALTGPATQKEVIKASIFCERCQRIGPTKDCKGCAAARASREPGEEEPRPTAQKTDPTAPKNGEEMFSLKKFNEYLGRAVAEMDKLARQHGKLTGSGKIKECLEHQAIRRKIDEAQKDLERWKHQLERESTSGKKERAGRP